MPQKVDRDTLQAILKAHIAAAVGSRIGSDGGGDIAADREKALKYYRGEAFGNEVSGRSSFVSRDVADTIEWMIPSILDIFVSSDEAVRFDPVGPEDEEAAKQATEVCNHIFYKSNDGFQVLYDMVKDALLLKQGIAKVFWEDKEVQKGETYKGLTQPELAKLMQEEGLDLERQTERTEQVLDEMGQVVDQVVIDARFIRTETRGMVRIVSVPPEEFLFSRRAVKLEDEQGNMAIPFVCHRVKKTLSDLVAEGFAWDEIKDIPSAYEGEYNEQRNARHHDDDITGNETLDASMREVWLHECYLRVDMDGDGIAETRKILVGGTGHTILLNEEVDEQPFATICPVPMPHAFVGDSVADQVMDVQELKSTILRSLLDNIYSINNSRNAVSSKVDLDSLLNNAVGGTVLVDTDMPDVAGHILPLQTPSVAGHIYPMLEYADQIRETRSGVSRLNQGLDPDALQGGADTASGMNMLMSAGQRRLMLIARIFASTGVRDMFRKILRLTIKYQDEEMVMRLRGGFTPVDPANWNAEMDVTINVGLGYGSREQQIVARRQILELQAQAIQMQGGIHGPLIYANHVSKAFQKFIEAAGEQQPDSYVEDVDPEAAHQPPPEQPSPEMAKLEAEMQVKQAELQMKGQSSQAEQQMKQQGQQADMQMKAQQAQQSAALEREKLQAQIELERERARVDMQIAMMRANMEREIAMMKAGQQVSLEREKAAANVSIEKERMDREDQRQRERPEPKEKEAKSETVVPNITIQTGSKKRRVNVERDDMGGIIGASVEDDD